MGVMGAGSLGTIIGALLSKAGQDVELIDSNAEHVLALNEKGATVTGHMDFNVPVKALTPDKMSGEYDIIFYLVKATNDAQALPVVNQYLSRDGFVVTMQNGIPEEKVAAVVGKPRTLGCAIGWGATWMGPGVSQLTSVREKMTYDVGEMDGSDTPRLNQVIEILKPAGIPEKTGNLLGLRWTKLCANATFSGMSTVIGGTYGDVLENPKAVMCAAYIAKEVLAVVDAAGVSPEPIQGFEIKYLNFNNKKELNNVLPVYGIMFGPHRNLKASMLQDIEKGRPCEIGALNGAISEWAARYSVATPVNDKVVEIIKKIEAGELKASIDNLDLFVLPELPEE
jgi:2-dehydropantoate 2-reductase